MTAAVHELVVAPNGVRRNSLLEFFHFEDQFFNLLVHRDTSTYVVGGARQNPACLAG